MEFNACDKADDFKSENRKEDLVDNVHQAESVGEFRLRRSKCETCNEREWKVLQNVLQRGAKEMD
jgi:hypothetical protein